MPTKSQKRQRRFEKILGIIIILMAINNMVSSFVKTNTINRIIELQNTQLRFHGDRSFILTVTTFFGFLANIIFIIGGYIIYSGRWLSSYL